MLILCEDGTMNGHLQEVPDVVIEKDKEGKPFFAAQTGERYFQTVVTRDDGATIFRWDPPRRA